MRRRIGLTTLAVVLALLGVVIFALPFCVIPLVAGTFCVGDTLLIAALVGTAGRIFAVVFG